MGRLLGDSNSAREDAESRLTERNEELSTILSLSPDGLVSFDAAGRVTETNPAFLAMTGWSRDEPDRRRARRSGRGSASSAGARSRNRAPRRSLRLQHPRPPCSSAGWSGRRRRQVAYFRDVTQADELDRTKSHFVATAAHELRTPIAVITGYAELLQASDPPAGQRGEILATMRRHGDQITGIVSELLDLARIEARAGRDFTMIRQPLAPAVRALRRLLPGRRVRARAALEGDIGDAEVFVDADKFCQALGNVIANACKYSPPGEPIAVRLVEAAEEVGVHVHDRGEGMDEETQRRIFERFYRAESHVGRRRAPGSA